MKTYKKNKESKPSYSLLFITLMTASMVYMSCSSKSDRSNFIKNSISQQNEEEVGVELKESDVVVESVEIKELDEESKEQIEEDFDFIMSAFESFKNPETAFGVTHEFLEEQGFNPSARSNGANKIIITSDESLNGLSYFRARFDADANPEYFTFEVDAVKGGFELAHELVKKYYPNLGEPCHESVDNVATYQDGEFLISIYEYTKDDVEQGHANKPRLAQHIGAVEVIIEYDIHPGTCGAGPEDHDHNHDHSSHH